MDNSENKPNRHFSPGNIRKKVKEILGAIRSNEDTVVSTTDEANNDNALHESSYGFTEKSRRILTYVITAAICGAIIGGSYFLALLIPGDKTAVNNKAAELRGSEDYKKIKSEYDSLIYDVNKLRTAISEKQVQLEGIDNIDNTKADLRAQIESKQNELNALETEVKKKEAEAEALSKEITDKFGAIKTLTPGTYLVGSTILPGNYFVTGNGKFNVASGDKFSKLNTVLTSEPF